MDASVSITRTARLVSQGYPFMIFGNGQFSIAETDRGAFERQLKKMSGKTFWTEAAPDKYAQFRAAGAAATGSSKPWQGLFQRLAHPPAGNNAPPADADDRSTVN
jgi:hypothetical protein